ncbi:DedA family protein [Streptomyces sp. DSM 44915]|uniref:DedA family protein n=1 Tax=Streptomyces chisholmiae TaxID=3075540 RepID=A0ABU2JQI1_9ACTN|nr:DedA family protein [Streptomyces sp. DSM 44915]MDT0267172.1 DedA family protein [Streptomyces sp. DSM 44915]
MNALALGPHWLDPEHLIQAFGLAGLLLVVFAESGLLVGFFLPGDSLLFTTGLLVAAGEYLHQPLWLVCLLIVLAAVLGDQVGYLTGRRVGPALFRRPDARLFKRQHVARAHVFFERHGPKSLVLARFVPVVRTFTPIVAGVSGMAYRPFVLFNVLGGVLWGAGVTLLGAALGGVAFVHEHIEAMLIGIVLLSVLPVLVELLRARRTHPLAAGSGPDGAGSGAEPDAPPTATGQGQHV